MWAQERYINIYIQIYIFFLRNRLILNFHPPSWIILSRHTRNTTSGRLWVKDVGTWFGVDGCEEGGDPFAAAVMGWRERGKYGGTNGQLPAPPQSNGSFYRSAHWHVCAYSLFITNTTVILLHSSCDGKLISPLELQFIEINVLKSNCKWLHPSVWDGEG